MCLGQVGPFTEILESLATAIGAGMLLGGFVLGGSALLAGRPRQAVAERALTDGFAGGVLAAAVAAIDLLVRYV